MLILRKTTLFRLTLTALVILLTVPAWVVTVEIGAPAEGIVAAVTVD